MLYQYYHLSNYYIMHVLHIILPLSINAKEQIHSYHAYHLK